MQDVRNNRQYDALNKEVEFQNLEIELQKKKIGEAQRLIREKEILMEEAFQRYDDKTADLEEKKHELNDIIRETHKDEDALKAKSKKLAAAIDDRLLFAYRRIRDNARNGLAVVTVDRDACGGCFNKIPPQRQLDIRSRKKIIVCEYCGRILIDKYICDYDGSQAQADLEASLETMKKKTRRPKRED
jgi:predicted  nucleic acid-binding Zn-ribbon protein